MTTVEIEAIKMKMTKKRRRKMKKLLRLFGMVLVTVMVSIVLPVSVKAEAKSVCQTLEVAKTYQYNLDQQGKKESIKVTDSKKQYKHRDDTVYDHKVKVTINGDTIYSKTIKGSYDSENPVKVMVLDTDKKDKQMELLILEGWVSDAWTADIEHIYYYQYAKGKAKRKQDLAPLFKKNFENIYSLHGMEEESFLTTDGKKEVYAKLCVEVNNFDYVHIKKALQLKKGKFMVSSAKSYALLDTEDGYFRPKKNITVYTKPGGKQKAFTVKKKEKIYLCGLYRESGNKIYLKVKNKSGKEGYIDPKKVSTYDDGTNHV